MTINSEIRNQSKSIYSFAPLFVSSMCSRRRRRIVFFLPFSTHSTTIPLFELIEKKFITRFLFNGTLFRYWPILLMSLFIFSPHSPMLETSVKSKFYLIETNLPSTTKITNKEKENRVWLWDRLINYSFVCGVVHGAASLQFDWCDLKQVSIEWLLVK